MRFGFGICGLALFISACGCQNELQDSVPAPDGRHVAVLFQRNCGATTGDNLELSLIRSAGMPHGDGNAFIADAPARDSAGMVAMVSLVKLQWLSTRALQVSYDRRLRVFRQETRVEGITVSYRPW